MIDGDVQTNVPITLSKINNICAFWHIFVHNSFNKICVILIQALWNSKSSHLSRERLSKMPKLYPNDTHDNKVVCNICYFVKHKKLPYNFSYFKATQRFVLLHFNI